MILKIFSVDILRLIPKIWLQTQVVGVCFFTAVFSTEFMSLSLLWWVRAVQHERSKRGCMLRWKLSENDMWCSCL